MGEHEQGRRGRFRGRLQAAWRRASWLAPPFAVTLAVLIAGRYAASPLRDAASLRDVSDVYLVRPAAYLLFAPLSDLLDALSLASQRQSVALVTGLVVVWAVLRIARPDSRQRSVTAHAASLAALLACVVAAYAAAALLPRPMAYLESPDPDVVRVDFHSHTSASKDAREAFSVAANRAWHRDGGYDVAYVTDHHAFADRGKVLGADPPTGRDGVMLLSGIEVGWRGEHVGVLGAESTCRGVLSADLRVVDEHKLAEMLRDGARVPIIVWNHPRDARLAVLPAASTADGRVSAIEESNGAPHARDLVREKHARILALARRDDLAAVAGTDSHGWGHAPPNWTLLRIENWRRLDRSALEDAIERAIRSRGSGATRIVERASADPGGSAVALALSAAVIPARMLVTLSPDERRMWLAWTWMTTGMRLRWRSRQVRRARSCAAA